MKSLFYNTLYLLLSFLCSMTYASTEYTVKKITFLPVNSSINPATYSFLKTQLKKLSRKNGDLAFIKLNTPGGLVTTTKEIITLIGSLDYPVGVWITPEGASATSAGAIIASSAHLLVMSKGTNIGAATPITMGKDIEQKDVRSKAINDLVSLVSSLSKARGRAPKEFEKMISEAKSLGADDALKLGVIDKIISSNEELFTFINKRTVTVGGDKLTLSLKTSASKTVEMDIGQRILNIFANPTTAYVLFIIGAALLYFELQAPGGMIAGAVGVVFLVLAAIGFQVLPVNLGAIGLMALAFALFILEAYVTSFGILTIAGIAALIFGSLFLFRTDNSLIELEAAVIISVVSSISLYVGFLGWYFIKTYVRHKDRYTVSNHTAHVFKNLGIVDGQFSYQIKVDGEIWNATSEEELEIGQKVKVTKENDLHTKIVKD